MKQHKKPGLRGQSLTVRLTLWVVIAASLTLAAIGVYYDNFLRTNFIKVSQERMEHGFSRLAFNIQGIEEGLREGVRFIQSHEPTLASIQLINTYEDFSDYNRFLIDEEKKLLAAELLKRVKLSFNNDIAVYNEHERLITYVGKDNQGYHLNFVTYADGVPQLMRRREFEPHFQPVPLQLLDADFIDPKHTSYYTDQQMMQGSMVTKHHRGHSMVLKSHMSLADESGSHFIAHIEMSRKLDSEYLQQLSQDFGIELFMSDQQPLQDISGDLLVKEEQQALVVVEQENRFIGARSINTEEGELYIRASLDGTELNRFLADNRRQMILFLVVTTLAGILLMRLIIHRNMAQPLRLVMGQIRKIEQNDYSTSDRVASGDELELISDNLYQLARTVREREYSLEQSRSELEYLSNHDVLTNLPNRRMFADRLEYALQRAQRHQDRVAILFIDLDQFKQVNDTLGHNIGDQLLSSVAERLRNHLIEGHLIARIGGDEFNILIEDLGQKHELDLIAEHYLALFATPFDVAGQDILISASIGITLYPDHGSDSVTLVKNADMAMYRAKDAGRNIFRYFSSDMSEDMRLRTDMTRALRDAIESADQFRLHYQPKISTTTGKIVSIEALIRWYSPEFGFVAPDKFIPLAEELGLIQDIGRWVFVTACIDFVRLKQMRSSLEHISINVSHAQLEDPMLLTDLQSGIKHAGIKPQQVELEITESYIAEDPEQAMEVLLRLRAAGFNLAIDDFGTGYSSMNALQRLPVNRLKIDKSFIDDLPVDRKAVAINRAIITLAKAFGLSLTAEGVELQAQEQFLIDEGCDEIQGYLHSRPLPFSELVQYCAEHETLQAERYAPKQGDQAVKI